VSYLRYLCLFAHSGIQPILCCFLCFVFPSFVNPILPASLFISISKICFPFLLLEQLITVNPRDCSDLQVGSTSGAYTIYPDNSDVIDVYPDNSDVSC